MLSITPSTITRTICVAFIAGVAFASWGYIFACVCMVLIFYLFIKYFAFENNKSRIILISLCVICIACGVVRYALTYPTSKSIANFVGQSVVVEGTISKSETNEEWQKIILSDIVINDKAVEDRLSLITIAYPDYEYGSRISVACDIEAPMPIDDFDYDRYLWSKNIWATCFSYQTWLVDSGFGNPIITSLFAIRDNFILQIDKIFGEPHSSLLIGLLLGEKRFTDEWEQRFLRTGTTHIVAASGYNISIVLWVAMGFFASLGVKRQKAFAFLVASIACYILLAGADSAVFRAGVMGIVLLLARQSERKSNMVSVLLATMALMLVINPRLLRDDVGFQLSMSSTIGLIYLSPIFLKKLKWIPKDFLIRESIIATLSATLASFPILILRFGSFSFVSLFVNALVLPWVPIAMAGGAIATLIGLTNISLGAIASAPSWLGLTIILWIVKIFAQLNLYAQSIHWAVALLVLIFWIAVMFLIIKNYAINKITN